MDWPLIHIMINHFPIILALLGALGVVLGSVRSRRGIWLYATASLTLAAIAVVPTYFTGAPAEHALNRPWYVARGVMNSHEDAAKISAILVLLAGLIAAFAWRRLVRYPREVKMPGGLRAALLVTSLAGAGAIGHAAWLGTRIVHDSPVLQGPAPAGFVPPGTPASAPAPAPVTGASADSAASVSAPADSIRATTPTNSPLAPAPVRP